MFCNLFGYGRGVIAFESDLLQAVPPNSDWSCISKTFKNEDMQLRGTSPGTGPYLTQGKLRNVFRIFRAS